MTNRRLQFSLRTSIVLMLGGCCVRGPKHHPLGRSNASTNESKTKPSCENACPSGQRIATTAAKRSIWQFTTADARIKLRRLYPQIQME
jgi:hypothetical protein